MRRALTALTAFTAATLPIGAAWAAGTYTPPSQSERLEARREFLEDALRTVSDRSGDVFFLPRKFNFLTAYGPNNTNLSHVKVGGELKTFNTPGIAHGVPWTYDRDIPLVVWGPGFIKNGQTVKARTAQQDIAPTIAQLIGCPRPTDTLGRVLNEALLPTQRKPKVVLTVLFDQGGENYYRLHPGATPFVDRLKREGTYFANTRVSHLDMETAMGHVAVGTGAFPREHGMPSNDFWHGGHGEEFYTFEGPGASSPTFLMSPTVGDWWLKHSKNQALLFSYCYADRAAMGMGGHGSFYKGNKKPWVYYMDTQTGKLTTNSLYYELPAYLKDMSLEAEAARLWSPERNWMGHALKKPKDFLYTPAMPRFDAEHVTRVIANEAFGQDDVPDLMYVTLKSTDMAGHLFGQESEESGAVLAEQDRQFERIVDALAKKVGRENMVVFLCADHGGPPLPELTGGKRLMEEKLVGDLNRQLDKTDDGFPLVQFVSGTQLWIDKNQLKASRLTLEDVKRAVEAYQVDGEPYFEQAYTRDELETMTRLKVYGGR